MCVREGRTCGVHAEAQGGRKEKRGRTGGPTWGLRDRAEIQAARAGDRQAGRRDGQCAPAAFALVRSPVQKTFL